MVNITRLCHIAVCLLTCTVLFLPASAQTAAPQTDEQPIITAARQYSPFDDPKPKIPEEILKDKRLDQRLKVFVKNQNLRDLFRALSRKTGVSITNSRLIASERPIIYFHDRPLRDIMVELSSLYGYHWLVKGTGGKYSYELFEDINHSKRRVKARQDRNEAQLDSLFEAIDICSKALNDERARAELQKTNPRLYASIEKPNSRELLRLILLFDKATLRKLLDQPGGAYNPGVVRNFSDYPPEFQAGILSYYNLQMSGADGFVPRTAQDPPNISVRFKAWVASLFDSPHVWIKIVHLKDGKDTDQVMYQEWPTHSDAEGDMLALPDAYPDQVIGDPLPDKPEILLENKRKVLYSGAPVLGDAVRAIALQSGMDVIADYYLQENKLPLAANLPLDDFVRGLTEKLAYTCQVDGRTLRFRYNRWFVQQQAVEPDSKSLDRWWQDVETLGYLTISDMLDIACLPDDQMRWSGLRFIPGAQRARQSPTTLRIWRALGEHEAEARTPAGVPVAKLPSALQNQVYYWAGLIGVDTSLDLTGGAITITEQPGQVNRYEFAFCLPDGQARTMRISTDPWPLNEADRKLLAIERKAEAAEEVIEPIIPDSP